MALDGEPPPGAADMNRAFTHATDVSDVTVAYYAASQMLVFTVEQFGMPKVVRRAQALGARGADARGHPARVRPLGRRLRRALPRMGDAAARAVQGAVHVPRARDPARRREGEGGRGAERREGARRAGVRATARAQGGRREEGARRGAPARSDEHDRALPRCEARSMDDAGMRRRFTSTRSRARGGTAIRSRWRSPRSPRSGRTSSAIRAGARSARTASTRRRPSRGGAPEAGQGREARRRRARRSPRARDARPARPRGMGACSFRCSSTANSGTRRGRLASRPSSSTSRAR